MPNIWFGKKKEDIQILNDDFYLPFFLLFIIWSRWISLIDKKGILFSPSSPLQYFLSNAPLLSGVEGKGRAAALLGGPGCRLRISGGFRAKNCSTIPPHTSGQLISSVNR